MELLGVVIGLLAMTCMGFIAFFSFKLVENKEELWDEIISKFNIR